MFGKSKSEDRAPDSRALADFSDLKAVAFNCSLEKNPADSHTRRLMSASEAIMRDAGVAVEHVHMAEQAIPPGVHPDMTKRGWSEDVWPEIWKRVEAADIMLVGTPLWLGEESSLCRILIERLYAMSGELNDKGQSVYYGKVGGAVITGNEDGVKHASMTILYALQHLGFVIPPQADCGWIGEAGPGPSFGDVLEDGSRAGFDNDFTRRNTTIMTWNLLHLARMLKDTGGLPNHGNDRRAFKDGERFGYREPA